MSNDRKNIYPKWQNDWESSRFIVDAYHWINHKSSDDICVAYCNPTPIDTTSNDLVELDIAEDGTQTYYRKFNTEASEQLNAWQAGFEQILKRMTITNFNWFLHVMLYMHYLRLSEETSTDYKRDEDDLSIHTSDASSDELDTEEFESDELDNSSGSIHSSSSSDSIISTDSSRKSSNNSREGSNNDSSSEDKMDAD